MKLFPRPIDAYNSVMGGMLIGAGLVEGKVALILLGIGASFCGIAAMYLRFRELRGSDQ